MSHDSLGYVIDDSALFHRAPYDPAKARAYYLANRKLKGRQKGSQSSSQGSVGGASGEPNRAKTKSRQAELRAQAEALRKRLDRLQEVLAELVEAAQKRSGGDPNKNNKDEKDKAPETKTDKADRNKAEKKDKPETASEKKEKAKKAKEEYEKEHPTSLSKDVDILKAQVEDIQTKIKKALADARDRRNKAGEKLEESGSKNKQLDGPRGR